MATANHSLTFFVNGAIARAVDEHRAQLQAASPGTIVSRSDAIRSLVLAGIERRAERARST